MEELYENTCHIQPPKYTVSDAPLEKEQSISVPDKNKFDNYLNVYDG